MAQGDYYYKKSNDLFGTLPGLEFPESFTDVLFKDEGASNEGAASDAKIVFPEGKKPSSYSSFLIHLIRPKFIVVGGGSPGSAERGAFSGQLSANVQSLRSQAESNRDLSSFVEGFITTFDNTPSPVELDNLLYNNFSSAQRSGFGYESHRDLSTANRPAIRAGLSSYSRSLSRKAETLTALVLSLEAAERVANVGRGTVTVTYPVENWVLPTDVYPGSPGATKYYAVQGLSVALREVGSNFIRISIDNQLGGTVYVRELRGVKNELDYTEPEEEDDG